MVCKLYGKPGEFLEENRDFLLENEALVQLNLGNAQTHREEGCHPGLWRRQENWPGTCGKGT